MKKLEEVEAERVKLERVEKALDIQQKKMVRLLSELFHSEGRGPHTFSTGASYVICNKGDNYYLMPCKKTA